MPNDMRDRLVELLGDYLYSEQIADHLIQNGVILPPCQLKRIANGLEKEKQIIYCQDCCWWGTSGCAIEIVDDSDRPKANDYCSFGERKG